MRVAQVISKLVEAIDREYQAVSQVQASVREPQTLAPQVGHMVVHVRTREDDSFRDRSTEFHGAEGAEVRVLAPPANIGSLVTVCDVDEASTRVRDDLQNDSTAWGQYDDLRSQHLV